ncbi:MAG: pyridoxamine 5'-phosphate oxidase [Leptolyngbyaceae cyanobacterium SM1_1_3]|nr:pyridoxamine 5'-phosphate oxidase [Leptolyngbyaceae cyanobacterium SM1_1_3]NJN01484.1 pyridoxamine 5'-phosphate oxidase [Leptolyngbyaceae cyanobacterium RM1_1_2]NJO08416.1 pyridoxamine 5'-phosphate oxidase [Leptolyngbyaceae cyanobacterium SL_1_1]
MSLAPWRSPLARALHRNRSDAHARYLQLATLRCDQRPANRTVVFRGFLAETNRLQFVTDSRSDKIEQIEQNPWGEGCWYFVKTREQFRLLGKLTVVGPVHAEADLLAARQKIWQQLSDSARNQFVWPQPGAPRSQSQAFETQPPAPERPLSNFCLLLLTPLEVDHLELRGEPQNRYHYFLHHVKGWSEREINP